jgi:hypothetical protein
LALQTGGKARQDVESLICGQRIKPGFVDGSVAAAYGLSTIPAEGACVTRLDEMAARLDAALSKLETAAGPLVEARSRAKTDAATITSLNTEREDLYARVATLEEDSRSLLGITEEVEGRLDGAIAEIRQALGR